MSITNTTKINVIPENCNYDIICKKCKKGYTWKKDIENTHWNITSSKERVLENLGMPKEIIDKTIDLYKVTCMCGQMFFALKITIREDNHRSEYAAIFTGLIH